MAMSPDPVRGTALSVSAGRSSALSGNGLAVASMLTWAAGFPAAEVLLQSWPPVALLVARLAFFVFLPTVLAGYYFYTIATPMYATKTEFLILKSLVARPGHVKTRDQLMDAAYGEHIYVDDRTIDSHIKRLRKKFRLVDGEFNHIETLYGVGYRYKDGSQAVG